MRKTALLIFGLVMLSGCTQSTTNPEGAATSKGRYGLVIDEFSTDLRTLEEGDTATLILSFNNDDAATATNVWGKVHPGGLVPIDTEGSDILELEPNNTDYYEFNLKAPDELRTDHTYTPYAELCYNYVSGGYANAYVVDQGKYTSTKVPDLTTYSERAPMQVSLSLSTNIVKIADTSKNKTLRVKLTNMDTGSVYSGSAKKDGSPNTFPAKGLKIRIPATTYATITPDEGSIWSCTSSGGETVCENIGELSLGSSGTSKSVSLNVGFNINTDQEEVVFFIAEAKYRYCIQTDYISISVSKIV
jgi:hypothetical protein